MNYVYFIFVYIQTSHKTKVFVYKWKKTMIPISKRQRACFYIHKNQKNCESFINIYKKHDTLQKQDDLRYVFIHQKPDTLLYAIFHDFLIGIYL